jgi:hypothetical protein
LANICKILADHGINLDGVAGYAMGEEAAIMLITDDCVRASEALQQKGYSNIKENNILEVELENKVGALKIVTGKISEAGIDIKYAYGTTCSGSCAARIIMNTTNNDKALLVLRGK